MVGCLDLNINTINRILSISGVELKEGEFITIDGITGNVYKDEISLIQLERNEYF